MSISKCSYLLLQVSPTSFSCPRRPLQPANLTERTCYKAASPLQSCSLVMPPRTLCSSSLLFQLLPVPNFALGAQVAMSAILAVLAAALLPKPQQHMKLTQKSSKENHRTITPSTRACYNFSEKRAPVKW